MRKTANGIPPEEMAGPAIRARRFGTAEMVQLYFGIV